MREIAQYKYLNYAHIKHLSGLYSSFACIEMRDMSVK